MKVVNNYGISPLLAHLVGDYVTQSHWEASEKTKSNLPAISHALKYTAAFVPITRDVKALAIIGGTHFILDRYRLAHHVNWVVNQGAPKRFRYKFDKATQGAPVELSEGLATALTILTDNTMHLLINHYALTHVKA